MARVTVEDCVDKVENRFELVMLAAHRVKQIVSGSPLLVDRDNDKNPVVALREIAEEEIEPEELREDAVAGYQKYVEIDEPEEDNMAALMGEDEALDEDISEEEMLRALQGELG